MTILWFEPNAYPETIKICNGFVAKLEKLQMSSSVQLASSLCREGPAGAFTFALGL
jgi:hypothetical protein